MRRKTWLILALILIPLWIIGAGAEIADSFLIRKEGTVITGAVNPGQWIRGKRRYYQADVSYHVNGREWRKEFRLPPDLGLLHADESGTVTNPEIQVRYAPSKPQVAELVALPSDSPWISLMVASLGFCVITAVFVFLYRGARK